jgi:hypothetical protein
MKLCATCGTPHPDHVRTSHHPDNCTCGLSLCGGTGPSGCIWSIIYKLKPGETRADLVMAQADLILARDTAVRKQGGVV